MGKSFPMKWDRIDAFQRRYRITGFVYAVQKKYSEDRGGYLAALIVYYAFVSLFPLLLAGFTIVAYALSGDPSAIRTVERHVSGYPFIGTVATQLSGAKVKGSPVAVVIGVLGLIYGGQGLAQAAEFTMQQAWNVENTKRLGFVPRLWRALAWYATMGVGLVASTFVTSIGSIFGWSGGSTLSSLMAWIINLAVFVASFRIISPPVAKVRELIPGAVFAGTCWTFLTGLGVGFAHELAHSNELYGTFAGVLGLLAFVYLTARLTIYGVEANVVKAHHLWPRSLISSQLQPADEEQLANLAKREVRVKGEKIQITP